MAPCQPLPWIGFTALATAPLTTTSHAVLGLLSVRPWTTYELAQQVERSLGWFWPRTPRKIYDEAKRLVDAGLADVHDGDDRPPATHRLRHHAHAGREALAGWLDGPSDDGQVRVRGGGADLLRRRRLARPAPGHAPARPPTRPRNASTCSPR